ncbi:hypothetical protein ONE63_007317 [Megalurothrips usitatus]|uniref:CCHC-type domain-containing protein n=1 Tax=Megalurothrips usitatus TaxID=439358 RepID=A0AAV7XVT8_9NEOP|nr:hypothetical protein ONE63_007317 [Megalurothrips usitatus]
MSSNGKSSGSGGRRPPNPNQQKSEEKKPAAFVCSRCKNPTQRPPKDGSVLCYSCLNRTKQSAGKDGARDRNHHRGTAKAPVRAPSAAARAPAATTPAAAETGAAGPVLLSLSIGVGPDGKATIEVRGPPQPAPSSQSSPPPAKRATTAQPVVPAAGTAAAAGPSPATGAGANSGAVPKRPECGNCNRRGHRRADCPNPQRRFKDGRGAAAAAPKVQEVTESAAGFATMATSGDTPEATLTATTATVTPVVSSDAPDAIDVDTSNVDPEPVPSSFEDAFRLPDQVMEEDGSDEEETALLNCFA